MDRSVAQGASLDSRSGSWRDPRAARRLAIAGGVALAVLAFAAYSATRVDRYYDHFVWQASAFLEGQVAIRYPVPAGPGTQGNTLFQDVLPIVTTDGIARGLLPFPPLPALVLLPFVAVWGLATDDQFIFTVAAALDVAIAWWMLGRLAIRPAIRVAITMFLAFGTVYWFTAQVTTTWYQAHIVAMGLSLLAVGLALGGDRGVTDDPPGPDADTGSVPGGMATLPWWSVEPRQWIAGFLFGLACTARLPVVFAAPFFAFVGPGGDWRRRSWSAGLGAAIPVLALVLYNVATTGQPIHPAYDYLYALEANGYPGLGYHPEWSVEDPRYIPQNVGIAILGTPDIFPRTLPDSLGVFAQAVCTEPGASRGLFDLDCPLAVPRDTGMSVLLTSPAYLLALPLVVGYARRRLVVGALLAILAVSVFNLMHFSQGWVQFGYRFSNDVAPFALPLVALGAEDLARRRRSGMAVVVGLVVVSIAVNLWGVLWSVLLGW